MHSPVHSASGGMVGPAMSDGATSSWRALSPDHLQQHQQQQQQPQQQQQSSPQGPASAPLSPLQHAQAAAAQQAAAASAGSAGVSPIKALGGLQGDETVVYSALSRPLPDYALTHVFSQVGPGARCAKWGVGLQGQGVRLWAGEAAASAMSCCAVLRHASSPHAGLTPPSPPRPPPTPCSRVCSRASG